MPKHLVCDLDDSLIQTDCIFEQWTILFKRNPVRFFGSLIWLLSGRAYFKYQLSHHTDFDAKNLPYRQSILKVIQEFKRSNEGKVILASASPESWVNAVATHLNLFDHVLASNSSTNLKGQQKLNSIKALLGDSPWAYIGDSKADIPIWRESSEIFAVNPSRSLQTLIDQLNKPTHYIIDQRRPLYRLILKQIRVHQWAKNALLLLPLFAAHQASSLELLGNGLLAFLSFSFCASLIYILNDLMDLSTDRQHRTKQFRPFASGELSIKWALILIPILGAGAVALSSTLNVQFHFWLIAYFLMNLSYSFNLKRIAILDIVLLSIMYSIRIFAGAVATQTHVSDWLISFSSLFFFSLACTKRYTELRRSPSSNRIVGRGYMYEDAIYIQSLGIGSGLLSVLIFMLYIHSPEVRALYHHPEILWGTSTLLLYWISRLWLLSHRDQMNDDPVLFAIKDRTSWICLGLILILGVLAL